MPNWLGDMIMATALIKALRDEYKEATIDLIVKKDLLTIAQLIPGIDVIYGYAKKESSSWSFGKKTGAEKKYDLFFCLPNSFSSAAMAFVTGAKKRIGYKKELRSFLLTNSYKRPRGLHRVEEYLQLLALYTNQQVSNPLVQLQCNQLNKRDAIVVNINSEAVSRRLPLEKAIVLVNVLRKEIEAEIILIGSPKEMGHVNRVYAGLADTANVTNMAGTTSLVEMATLFSSVKVVLSTDSGPAHMANAVGTPVVVLFGAGDEHQTAPYNNQRREIIRLGKLPCEKCVSNKCKPYGTPRCLVELDNNVIVSAVKKYI